MKLVCTRAQADAMAAEARRTYPEECCGILVGRREKQTWRVTDVIPVPNVWEGARHDRYLLKPRALLHAERRASADGNTVLGFFHSHPNGQAEPSALDAELAWPDFVYTIVPIDERRVRTLRGWLLPEEEGTRFVEVKIQIRNG